MVCPPTVPRTDRPAQPENASNIASNGAAAGNLQSYTDQDIFIEWLFYQ